MDLTVSCPFSLRDPDFVDKVSGCQIYNSGDIVQGFSAALAAGLRV